MNVNIWTKVIICNELRVHPIWNTWNQVPASHNLINFKLENPPVSHKRGIPQVYEAPLSHKFKLQNSCLSCVKRPSPINLKLQIAKRGLRHVYHKLKLQNVVCLKYMKCLSSINLNCKTWRASGIWGTCLPKFKHVSHKFKCGACNRDVGPLIYIQCNQPPISYK